MEKGRKENEAAAGLFDGWQETMILSCLQGVMGRVETDDPAAPSAVAAILGDFTFLAGRPKENLLYLEAERPFRILVPGSEAWAAEIERCFPGRARRVTRYALSAGKTGRSFVWRSDLFEKSHLLEAKESLKDGFCLREIDGEIYRACLEQEWSRDLASQYSSYEDYRRLGLGVAVLRGEELVAGASSYSSFLGGIEIEIDTKEAYRRQGFACAAGAALILLCLERKLYPGWDAQNPASAALAWKLGYRLDYEYSAYEVYSG